MAAYLRDYPVRFRREEDIANVAVRLRRMHRSGSTPYFNVVNFIEQTLRPFLKQQGRELQIEFFEATERQIARQEFAYVTVEPLTLHIDRETWDLAKEGEPLARLVVAHEIGHLILHGHYPKAAFSNDAAVQLKAIPQGSSAEWQAIVFAEHFLLPTLIVSAFGAPFEIAIKCGVELDLAEKRFSDVKNRRFKVLYGVDICQICGEFSCKGNC